MVRFVLLLALAIVLARVFWRVVDAIIAAARDPSDTSKTGGPTDGVPMARDPVCGTFIIPDRAFALQDGRTRVFFCSEACRDKYRARTA
jgi:YHS domain-containing protein